MSAGKVFVVLLVTMVTVYAKSKQASLLTRLLEMVKEEDKESETVFIDKRGIYQISASQDSILFYIQTTSRKCRISCSEGATSLQRKSCNYSVIVTNDRDPSETYQQMKHYWDPRDQKATFQPLRSGQVYKVESCRLSDRGPTDCDRVWCMTKGFTASNENCSSRKEDMNIIRGTFQFARNVNTDPKSRRKAVMDDLNQALERLTEL